MRSFLLWPPDPGIRRTGFGIFRLASTCFLAKFLIRWSPNVLRSYVQSLHSRFKQKDAKGISKTNNDNSNQIKLNSCEHQHHHPFQGANIFCSFERPCTWWSWPGHPCQTAAYRRRVRRRSSIPRWPKSHTSFSRIETQGDLLLLCFCSPRVKDQTTAFATNSGSLPDCTNYIATWLLEVVSYGFLFCGNTKKSEVLKSAPFAPRNFHHMDEHTYDKNMSLNEIGWKPWTWRLRPKAFRYTDLPKTCQNYKQKIPQYFFNAVWNHISFGEKHRKRLLSNVPGVKISVRINVCPLPVDRHGLKHSGLQCQRMKNHLVKSTYMENLNTKKINS